jgi:predicted ArsR family transcriptional regulator
MSRHMRDADLSAIGLLDEPVRRRLYDWVAAQARPVGREEAARSLSITRALATFHLDRLAEAGLLETDYRRLTGRVGPGAGRPARVYWRSNREFEVSLPERHYERAAELFATALGNIGSGAPPPILGEAARDLGRRLGRGVRHRRPEKRLTAALERAGYEPFRDANGTIRLRNCPFDALVDRHRPITCGTNLALAQGMTEASGSDSLTPVLDPQPGQCCVAFVPTLSRDPAPGR